MIKITKTRMICADSVGELESVLNEFCRKKLVKSIQYQIYNDSVKCKHIAMVLYEIYMS